MSAILVSTSYPLQAEDNASPSQRSVLDARFQQGLALHKQGQTDEAKAVYEQILALEPRHADALHLLGVIAAQADAPALAEALISQAIAINPNKAAFYTNLGLAIKARDRLDEAIAHFDKAIALQPDSAEAYSNRGLALYELKRTEEALACFDKAVALKPDYADAHYNRGHALKEFMRVQEGIASFDKAIAIQPDFVNANFCKSMDSLLTGQFETGWALYEWRWKLKELRPFQRHLPYPLWLGQESLAGKSILLYAEQGFGDTIQFCRYAQRVKNLGAHVTLEVSRPLMPLLAGLAGVDALVENNQPLPAFDYHCPLLSLPLAFKTELATIPSPTPYLASDPKKVETWAQRLGPAKAKRVGIVWRGNADHLNDHHRSLTLAQLVKHLPQDLDYVSLQKELHPEDRKALAYSNIRHQGDELKDFSDTAALCQLMDVVITVDTSVAHLAASLGKPTWVMLPYIPDWRWMLGRDDSPWYASVKLYRQGEDRLWEPVLQRLAQDLKR